MAVVARCSRAPRGLLLPRAGECHRRRGAGMPLRRAARGPAALALSSPASTVPCPPPARGPPASQRRVLGVELREGAGRAAPWKAAGWSNCVRQEGVGFWPALPAGSWGLWPEGLRGTGSGGWRSRTAGCLAGTVDISAGEALPRRLKVWLPFTIS